MQGGWNTHWCQWLAGRPGARRIVSRSSTALLGALKEFARSGSRASMGNAQSGQQAQAAARPGLRVAGSESDDDVQDLGQFWAAEGHAHGAPVDSDDENVVVSHIESSWILRTLFNSDHARGFPIHCHPSTAHIPVLCCTCRPSL